MSELRQAALNHAALRERLKVAYGLADDNEALSDTLDGISDFREICLVALRAAIEREAMAEAMDSVISANRARKARHEQSAQSIRLAVAEAMADAGEKSIKAADLTVSMRWGQPRLIIDDARLPEKYTKTKVVISPDRDAIQAAIDAGEVPEGVQIDNPRPSITVRTK